MGVTAISPSSSPPLQVPIALSYPAILVTLHFPLVLCWPLDNAVPREKVQDGAGFWLATRNSSICLWELVAFPRLCCGRKEAEGCRHSIAHGPWGAGQAWCWPCPSARPVSTCIRVAQVTCDFLAVVGPIFTMTQAGPPMAHCQLSQARKPVHLAWARKNQN